ncbi:MAG: 3-dehydroquinate synthase, partial [Clostridiales bacterium]|nr:3-dehydroquinate synthase [Clostridiales bacterium]
MKKIHVTASTEYDVIVSKNLIANLGATVREVMQPCKAAVIADDKVFGLYGKEVLKALEKENFNVCSYSFKNGEQSKNLTELSNILEFLAENHITRSDIVIAVGGGVTGDMAGFAASVYLRGIRFVQVPTTFLAAVDASVGGKTAVNLKSGKNLAGAFHQPSLVVCDTDTFNSLDKDTFSDGISEAIKCGVLKDRELFNMMKGDIRTHTDDIVERCVTIKRDLVSEDEFDTGA